MTVRTITCLLVALAYPVTALAQSTATATFTQWDIFNATGGGETATQNVAAIVRDATGQAGPAGSIWFTGQNPKPRLGRLDPDAATNNYTEWRPFTTADTASGAPLGLAVNPSNGDMWMSIQGSPSILLKLGFTNNFRRFDASKPLTPQGIAVASDGSLYVALPGVNAIGQGRAIIRVPRDLTSTSVAAPLWRLDQDPVGEPKYLAIDASGNVWYTDHANNLVGRLNPSTDTVTEWALPVGSNPVGLQLSGSSACVISDGLAANAGTVQCLDTTLNQVSVFAAPNGAGLDRPQQLARNSFNELFVTESRGNSAVFISQEAYGSVTYYPVTPVTRVRNRSSITLYPSNISVTPIITTVVPSVTTITGADLGGGKWRFSLPVPTLTYPFSIQAYPQPFGITAAFNDFERGTGTAFLAEYFNGPIGEYAAARIDKIEVVAPRVIETSPNALTFSMDEGGAPPGSQTIAVTETNGLSLSWTATSSQPWVTASPASGTAPASITVSVNPAGLGVGTHTATLTLDDGPAKADPKNVLVTFTINALPTMVLSPSSLSFSADSGANPAPASSTFTVSNSGGGTLDCSATADQVWITVSESSSCVFTVSLDPATAPAAGGTYAGSITVTSPGATNSGVLLPVTFTRAAAPAPGAAISVSPTSLSFTVITGTTASSSQAVSITNTGGQPLTWSPSTLEPWLTVSGDTSEIAPGATRTLLVTLNSIGLTANVSGVVTVTSNGSASPVTISVAVTVTESAPADTVAPVVTVPASITAEATGASGAVISFTATALDDVSGSVPVTCTPASGTTFALATTTVTCTATDAANNTDTETFSVTVQDTTPPSITVPSNMTVAATSGAGATVAFTPAPTAQDVVSGALTPVCQPASGTTFAIGATTVSCTATDAAGKSASASFTVTVTDESAPTLSLPANITAPATSASGANVTYTVTASDPIGTAAPTVSCTPASGSPFPVGTTTVNCTATDGAGNASSGSFTVSITPQPPAITLSAASMIFKTGRLAYCNGWAVGPNWKEQGLGLTNTGGSALSYTTSTTTPWLLITPAFGSLGAGASLTLTVAVDLTALGRGIYQGGFTIAGNGTSQYVPVTLEIGNALPTLCLTPVTMGLGRVKSGSLSTSQAYEITNVGDDPIASWSSTQLASDGTLQVSKTSGGLPSLVSVSVKAGRKKGAQNGTITVTASNGSGGGGGGGGGKKGGGGTTTTTTTTGSTIVNGTQNVSLTWTVE